MDGHDTERRIADLEPPVGTLDASTSRRFTATAAPPSTKQMMKYTQVAIVTAIASLGAVNMVLFVIGALVGTTTDFFQISGTVMLIAFLVGAMPAYAAFQRRIYRRKTVLIDVRSDGLTVSTKPGLVFAFNDAQLGRWTIEGYNAATKGLALHVRRDRESFVIGGRDHRVASEAGLKASPVSDVDAWLWPDEFDDLLAAVGLGRSVKPASGESIRCLLIPNPARLFSYSFFGMFKNTATALSLNANPPRPSLAIDVRDDTVSVIDLKSGKLISSAAPAQISATPAESTRSMPRVGKMTMPALVVSVPNSQSLTIGCPDFAGPPQATWKGTSKFDYRFGWRDEVRTVDDPAYVVSDPDWLTLVETLGLTPRMEDRAKPDVDQAPAPLAQPKRKRAWVYALIIAAVMFVAAPVGMLVAGSITDHREVEDQLVKAQQLRPFALPFNDLRLPHGVAVDTAGNVYVTDTHANRVLKLAAGSSAPTVLPFTGLDFCSNDIDTDTASAAVDTLGNVYITDSCHHRVLKLAAGSNTQTVVPFRGLEDPEGVAVDSAGTVYVVDYSHGHVFKLAVGAPKQATLPPIGGCEPTGAIAADTAGNIYVSCGRGRHRDIYLARLSPGSNAWTTIPTAIDGSSDGVAVDAAGDVYTIASRGVMRMAAGSDTWTSLPRQPNFIDPMGLAVAPQGDAVFVTDHVGSRATGSGLPWEKDDAQGFVLKLPTR